MEARQAEEEIFETPDPAEEGDSAGSAAAIRLSRGLYQEREADPESLIPTSIDADSAFEVFHGKVFAGPRVDLSGSIAGDGVIGGAVREGTLVPPREKPVETPVERYLRLQAEIKQLSDDLTSLNFAEKERAAAGAAELGESSVWQHLAKQLNRLSSDLGSLSNDSHLSETAVDASSSGSLSKSAANVTDDLLRRVEDLQREGKAAAAAVAQGSEKKDAGEQQQVVYELFYDPSRAAARLSKLQALEGRIASLEKAVSRAEDSETAPTGPAGIVLTSKSLTLADAVTKLEKQVSLLDSTSSETIRQRLVLLKNEWDDFKRERSKHATALDAHASAHHRRVESLFDSLKKLEPVANDLPTLVSRLQVLQGLHAESLDFSQRLSQLGTRQEALRELLKGTQDNLQEVRKSLADNVKQLADNIKAVDARIERLDKSSSRK